MKQNNKNSIIDLFCINISKLQLSCKFNIMIASNFRDLVQNKKYKSSWKQKTENASFRWTDYPDSEDAEAKEITPEINQNFKMF